jgi:nitrate reductase gamma subunit
MYVLLVGAIALGLVTTLVAVGAGAHAHDYRETVSPWFRSLFRLNPDVDAMADAPVQFHLHVLVGMLLFAAWPFTRLVHAFTAPVHYLFRPYIVYRSRDAQVPAATGRARPGWSPVGTTDRDRRPR